MGRGEGGDGGGILESLLESGNEEGDEVLLEGGIKLVRQPIRAQPLTARRLDDGGQDAVGREVRQASLGLLRAAAAESRSGIATMGVAWASAAVWPMAKSAT